MGWIENLENRLDESQFLTENSAGATAGRRVGGPAALGASVVALAAATSAAGAAAATMASAETVIGAATVTAAASSPVAFQAGYRVGQTAGKAAFKYAVLNAPRAAWTLGRVGGAYAGAGVQVGGRWVRDKLDDL